MSPLRTQSRVQLEPDLCWSAEDESDEWALDIPIGSPRPMARNVESQGSALGGPERNPLASHVGENVAVSRLSMARKVSSQDSVGLASPRPAWSIHKARAASAVGTADVSPP
jgi:hypothetical protein